MNDQNQDLEQRLLDALDPAQIMLKAGMTPDPWQFDVLRSSSRRILMVCSRRSGKTLVCAALALHQCLYIPESTVLLISTGTRNASEVIYKRIQELRRMLPLDIAETHSESTVKMVFPNHSTILVLPGDNGDACRGHTAQLVIVDEAARVDEQSYIAARPAVATTNGKIICLSTFNGAHGWFWNAFENEESWQKFRVTADECPRLSREFLEQERTSYTPDIFLQEYYCVAADSSEVVFPSSLFQTSFRPELKELDL